jgi:octaprenyl-diphosphate synthase
MMTVQKSGVAQLFDLVREDMLALDRQMERSLACDVALIKMMAAHLNQMRGKRLRPALLLLICKACDRISPAAVKAAASIELLHTATLVHDDVIDDSDLRRGLDTLNAVWGDNSSVLMGDFIFARAFNTLLDTGSPRLTPIFARAIERMSQGELLQVDLRQGGAITEESYFTVIREKTASLFGAATEMGGVICGADDTTAERFRAMGEAVGVAFQLTDDLLDYQGAEDVTGKPTGGEDLRGGKLTLPIIYTQRIAEGADRERLDMLVRDPDVDRNWPEILEFVHRCDGIGYTMQEARRYVDEALTGLDLLPRSSSQEAVAQLLEFILSREH